MSAEIVLFHAPQSCSRLPLRCDVVAFPRERIVRKVTDGEWLAYCDAVTEFMFEEKR